MKKKVIMLVLALALVFTMNTATAKAAFKNSTGVDWVYEDGDHYTANTLQAGFTDLTTAYGVRWTIEVADLSGGVGGGIIINGETNNWDQKEWGNEGAGKEFTIKATSTENVYTVTRLDSAPMFGANDGYANVCLSQWWGPEVVIKKVEILAKDGSVIFSNTKAPAKEETKEEVPETPETTEETVEETEDADAEEVVETTEEAAEDTAAEDTSANDTVPKTGVASVAVVYALGSLVSAAGIVASKKRK